jgi:hypothetical protein
MSVRVNARAHDAVLAGDGQRRAPFFASFFAGIFSLQFFRFFRFFDSSHI